MQVQVVGDLFVTTVGGDDDLGGNRVSFNMRRPQSTFSTYKAVQLYQKFVKNKLPAGNVSQHHLGRVE